MSWYSENKYTPSVKYWWEVVVHEECQGGTALVCNVVINAPYTKEHETKVTPIYNDKNGSIIWVMFELSLDKEDASAAAVRRLESYARTPQYDAVWSKTRTRYYKEIEEVKERDRLSQPATVGDIERLLAIYSLNPDPYMDPETDLFKE